jgi:ABC-2 type transport system ATP-binding protein
MNDSPQVIATTNLTRRFGPLIAVDALTVSVQRGEIFGLVGPDGAGKTTTLRMLAAIMDPSDGRATVAGYDTVKQAEAIKRRIGYMAQQFNLYGDLSVQENLDFYADVFGVRGSERKTRTARLLRFARLNDFTRRRAADLSGGMKKKLALACSLIHQPEILFLDEPTTGVDPISRREFWDILAELHVDGVSILVSTPYMDEAERCSRVGLMYQGRLVVCDTPEQIKRLVRGELIELRPLPVDPSSPVGIGLLRRAEAGVAGLAGVLEVQTYGDLLHVFVDDADKRIPQVEAALAAQDIRALDLRRAPARMEEAFMSLIRGQERGR